MAKKVTERQIIATIATFRLIASSIMYVRKICKKSMKDSKLVEALCYNKEL